MRLKTAPGSLRTGNVLPAVLMDMPRPIARTNPDLTPKQPTQEVVQMPPQPTPLKLPVPLLEPLLCPTPRTFSHMGLLGSLPLKRRFPQTPPIQARVQVHLPHSLYSDSRRFLCDCP